MDRRVEARVKMAQDEDVYPDVSDLLPRLPMVKLAEPTREHGLRLSSDCVVAPNLTCNIIPVPGELE